MALLTPEQRTLGRQNANTALGGTRRDFLKAAAVAGPIPGRASSSAAVARFRSTGPTADPSLVPEAPPGGRFSAQIWPPCGRDGHPDPGLVRRRPGNVLERVGAESSASGF